MAGLKINRISPGLDVFSPVFVVLFHQSLTKRIQHTYNKGSAVLSPMFTCCLGLWPFRSESGPPRTPPQLLFGDVFQEAVIGLDLNV